MLTTLISSFQSFVDVDKFLQKNSHVTYKYGKKCNKRTNPSLNQTNQKLEKNHQSNIKISFVFLEMCFNEKTLLI